MSFSRLQNDEIHIKCLVVVSEVVPRILYVRLQGKDWIVLT